MIPNQQTGLLRLMKLNLGHAKRCHATHAQLSVPDNLNNSFLVVIAMAQCLPPLEDVNKREDFRSIGCTPSDYFLQCLVISSLYVTGHAMHRGFVYSFMHACMLQV